MDSTHAYSEPEKVKARELALKHAVNILTTDRSRVAAVSQDHVRRVKDYLMQRNESHDREVAQSCDDGVIALWEDLWASHVGRKRPEELAVAYLAGPNPLNDFRTLVRLGVHPYNIWAFEGENEIFQTALKAIKTSEFPLLKIYSGSFESFLQSVPKVFDIIYVDACGPLPSASQGTLRLVANVFRYSRLASPGVLITNFARPDLKSDAQKAAYGDPIAAYLYPKGMVESGRPEWNMKDGPVAYGLYAKTEDAKESFYHRVLDDFDNYYGQYITRQLFDLGSFISPWIRLTNAQVWSSLFKTTPKDAAKLVTHLRYFRDEDADGDDDSGGDFIVEPDLYAVSWTLSALQNAAPNTVDENYPAMCPDSGKLRNKWMAELGGTPPQAIDARMALESYEVLRGSRGTSMRTAEFNELLDHYRYFHRMYMFCDVPTSELAFYPVIGQFAFPMHYNVAETRRHAYVASGKVTKMFLDVVPFDACRYIYDWLPTLELVENSFAINAHHSCTGSRWTVSPSRRFGTTTSIFTEPTSSVLMRKVLAKSC